MNSSSFQRLSQSIEALRFPLILFIIFLHCYTSTSYVVRGHDLYFRIIYPLSLWIGETGVPAYFFISGLLLFYSRKTYGQKLKSRIKTLLIPYLFFNSLILCAYLGLMILGKPADILGKDLADYSYLDYLRAFWDRGDWNQGNGAPLLCPFWYIRNLMVLAVLSPILYYIIRYTKLLLPLIVGIFWINAHHSAYLLQSLTMFSLGAYFPICDKSPIELFEKHKAFFICAFFFLATMDYLHLFVAVPFALSFHRLSLVANTLFMIGFLGGYLYRHKIYSSFLSKSAFFVFCIHYPMTTVLRPLFQKLSSSSDIILTMLYLASVICIALICILVYKVLNNIIPKFVNFVTGSRG